MKAEINGIYKHEIESNNGKISIDGQIADVDYIQLQGKHANFIYQGRSYNVEVLSREASGKLSTIKVNGNDYTVELQDKFELLLKQLGLDSSQLVTVKELKAPMPGLVLNVFIAVGMEVKKGDNLLILEAMKMENMIKSPADGRIKNVLIDIGKKVEKNQILIQFF